MDFDVPSIMVMLAASAVGFVYFRYGQRQADVPYIVAGVALMAYPYLVSSMLWLILIGAAIAAAPFLYRRFG